MISLSAFTDAQAPLLIDPRQQPSNAKASHAAQHLQPQDANAQRVLIAVPKQLQREVHQVPVCLFLGPEQPRLQGCHLE